MGEEYVFVQGFTLRHEGDWNRRWQSFR